MKIAVITCYNEPDYIRARTIRTALSAMPAVELIVIKNKSPGIKRYLEVLPQIIKVRFSQKPDAYLVTFRGYEILPFVLAIAGRKPVIADELVNPVLVVKEHRKHKHGLAKAAMLLPLLFGQLYYFLERRCRFIIVDTPKHARLAIKEARLKPDKVVVLPVGTEESDFNPSLSRPSGEDFKVFFYGKVMAPLHGLRYILEAATILRSEAITFHISGKAQTNPLIEAAQANGAKIVYHSFRPFSELAADMASADICLGGPFGLGEQSEGVITGKTFQAIALAKLTVIGDTETTRPYFKNLDNCLLVAPGDGPALAEAILWAKHNPDKTKLIGQAGYKLYQKQFSNKAIYQILEQVVTDLA